VVNNLRDRVGDARAGKRTLAVRLGRRGAIVEYALLIAIAYVIPAALAVRAPWAALPIATLPIGMRLVARVAGSEGRALNPLLRATARLVLLHSALLALGIALCA